MSLEKTANYEWINMHLIHKVLKKRGINPPNDPPYIILKFP